MNGQDFLYQQEIAKCVESCHHVITDCVASLQVRAIFENNEAQTNISAQFYSHAEIREWQKQFQLDTEEDHRELVGVLANTENSQMIINNALQVGVSSASKYSNLM